jgi:hypothetical protein
MLYILKNLIPMKQFILLTLSFCFTQFAAFSQTTPAEVENINFKTLKDNWVQMEIQIRANKNTAEDAKNERFVDNIKVMAYFGYERDSKTKSFDFYKAQVEIISIEQGKKNNVYFFMPGVIVDRDRLPKKPPYYFVALEVDGKVLPLSNKAYSQSSLNDDTLRSMKQKADAESEPNDFILMPHYSVPRNRLIEARLDTNKLAPLIMREPKE